MNKQYEKIKNLTQSREDVKNSDTKQNNSCKHRTSSNIEELSQRRINITAESKHQKI